MRRAAAVLVLLVCLAGAYLYWRSGRTGDAWPAAGGDQNVLLITIDTLRADALGLYGGRAATPHIDALARGGVHYTFAHAHAVMTLPSHASILTGRYPFDHGVRDNSGYRLSPDAHTVAEAVKEKGIATAAFVGAFPLDRQFGLDQGFDVYDDVGGRQVAQGELALTERRAEEVVAAARAWIEKQTGPWFAWIHVFDPHAPYAPPAPFDRTYAGEPYAGEVAYVDHALGPLFDLLRARDRRTTVILTSDHGEGLGDHGEMTHGTFAYESTLRVPLIVATLDRRRDVRGAVSDTPVQQVDIFPTVAALLGLELPSGLPGRSLLDRADRENDTRTTYFEAMYPMLTRGWAPLRGVIVGRDKYIDLPIEELYDLAADPREDRNLAPTSGERLRRGIDALRSLNAALPGEQTSETAEVRSRLQSLGYVSGSAPRKARYTEADDPKRLIELDRLMLEALDLHRSRRAGEAVSRLRDVIARRPDMTVAYRRLASIQWEAGRPADAIATLRETIEKNGRDLETEVRLGTYLAEAGHPGEAIPMLQRAATADPGNSEALNALGIAHARSGDAAQALRAFERAVQANPRDVFAYENIATVHLQRNDLSAAADAFRRALEQDPRSSRAHSGLGIIARQQGRIEEALAHWRRAVDLDRSNFDALYNLARELARSGRLEEARPYMLQFVQTAPPSAYGRDIQEFRRLLR
ncbi:MAG TPA: sulfatase-like hydrolase/transferase [Vicinamibacterales bacterium]|nr:sulfatase-like hydrolase/transferase [Vicinamibacterales bacterium]